MKLYLKIGQKNRDHEGKIWTVEEECEEHWKALGYAFWCRRENGGLSSFTEDGFFHNNRSKSPFNLVELVEVAPVVEVPKPTEPSKPKLSLKIGQKNKDNDGDIWIVERECSEEDKSLGYAFVCRREGGGLGSFTEDGFFNSDRSEDSFSLVELVEEAPVVEAPKPKLSLKIGQKNKDHRGKIWTVLEECGEGDKTKGYAFLCRRENGGPFNFTEDGFFWNDRREHPWNFKELVEDAPAVDVPKPTEPPKPKLSLRIGQKYRDHDRDRWTVEKECDEGDKAKGYAFLCRRENGDIDAFTEDGFFWNDRSECDFNFVELVEEASSPTESPAPKLQLRIGQKYKDHPGKIWTVERECEEERKALGYAFLCRREDGYLVYFTEGGFLYSNRRKSDDNLVELVEVAPAVETPKPKLQLKIGQKYKDHRGRVRTVERECEEHWKASGYAFWCCLEDGGLSAFTEDGFFYSNRSEDDSSFVELVEEAPVVEVPKPKLSLRIGQKYRDHEGDRWIVEKECSEEDKAKGHAFWCRCEEGGRTTFTEDGFYHSNRSECDCNFVELVEEAPAVEAPKPKLSLKIGQKYKNHRGQIWNVERECDEEWKAKGYAFWCRYEDGALSAFTEDGFFYSSRSERSCNLVELVEDAPAVESPKPKLSLRIGQKNKDHRGVIWAVLEECGERDKAKGYTFLCRREGGGLGSFTEDGFFCNDRSEHYCNLVELVEVAPAVETPKPKLQLKIGQKYKDHRGRVRIVEKECSERGKASGYAFWCRCENGDLDTFTEDGFYYNDRSEHSWNFVEFVEEASSPTESPAPKLSLKIGQKYRDHESKIWTVGKECNEGGKAEGYAFWCRRENRARTTFTEDGFLYSDRREHSWNFVEFVEEAPAVETPKPKLSLKIGQKYKDHDGDIWIVEKECSKGDKALGHAFLCRLEDGELSPFTEDGFAHNDRRKSDWNFVELVAPVVEVPKVSYCFASELVAVFVSQHDAEAFVRNKGIPCAVIYSDQMYKVYLISEQK